MKCIILAGGSGSRLWPLSRDMYPKQLLSIDKEASLLQQTFLRLQQFAEPENILTITNIKHFTDIRLQLNSIDKSGIVLAEPLSKNTAPAIACALEYFVQKQDEDDIVLIVPSDHLIKNTEAFQKTVETAAPLAQQGYIVTFGIQPTYPETGYGYIKTAQPLDTGYEVECFVEKPDIKTAEKYLLSSNYYWNGGIFMGKISTFMNEFKTYAPEIFAALKDLDYSKENKIKYSVYEEMPSISIDYAIMEKSKRIALVPLQSDWNDLGSWQAIYDVKEKNTEGNVLIGNVVTYDVKNSLIFSQKELVAAAGLEDLILVETEDAIMACKKSSSQDVKKLYEKLKNMESDTVKSYSSSYY